MDRLPTVLVDIIYSYIPVSTTYKLNNTLFSKNYPLHVLQRTQSDVRGSDLDNYMRYLIRKKCYLHLGVCLKICHGRWSNKWWKYKNKSYPNYISYLKALAMEYNSNKCRELIDDWRKSHLVCDKKRHKKIRTKNIKWSN